MGLSLFHSVVMVDSSESYCEREVSVSTGGWKGEGGWTDLVVVGERRKDSVDHVDDRWVRLLIPVHLRELTQELLRRDLFYPPSTSVSISRRPYLMLLTPESSIRVAHHDAHQSDCSFLCQRSRILEFLAQSLRPVFGRRRTETDVIAQREDVAVVKRRGSTGPSYESIVPSTSAPHLHLPRSWQTHQ